jgi:hypothetical protein
MDKSDILKLVLDQFADNFRQHPEQFKAKNDYTALSVPIQTKSIVWNRIIDLGDLKIKDPNSEDKTIIVTLCKQERTLRCGIYSKPNDVADIYVVIRYNFRLLSPSCRRFEKLFSTMKAYEKTQENLAFLKKFSSLFPGSFEKDILGK